MSREGGLCLDEQKTPGCQVLFGGFADACIRSGNLKILWKQYQQLLKTGQPVQVPSGQTFGSFNFLSKDFKAIARMKAIGTAKLVQRSNHLVLPQTD